MLKNLVQVTDSNCIKALAYNDETQSLLIKFKDSPFYSYDGVSVEVFNKLKNSPKKGQEFHRIKKTLPEPVRLDN